MYEQKQASIKYHTVKQSLFATFVIALSSTRVNYCIAINLSSARRSCDIHDNYIVVALVVVVHLGLSGINAVTHARAERHADILRHIQSSRNNQIYEESRVLVHDHVDHGSLVCLQLRHLARHLGVDAGDTQSSVRARQ